jgi:hypothetical protein
LFVWIVGVSDDRSHIAEFGIQSMSRSVNVGWLPLANNNQTGTWMIHQILGHGVQQFSTVTQTRSTSSPAFFSDTRAASDLRKLSILPLGIDMR